MFWEMFWGMFWKEGRGGLRIWKCATRTVCTPVWRLEEMEMRNANGLDDWQKQPTWKLVRVDDVGSLMCDGYVEERSFKIASACS